MAKMSTKFDWCKHLINDTFKRNCIVIHFSHYSAVVLIQNKSTLIADVYENYRFQKLYEPLICKSTSKREKKDAKLAALDVFQCDQSCQLMFPFGHCNLSCMCVMQTYRKLENIQNVGQYKHVILGISSIISNNICFYFPFFLLYKIFCTKP